MFEQLTDFGAVGSAIGSSTLGKAPMRNYQQGMGMAGKALQAEALARAQQFRNEVYEKTGGRLSPLSPLSTTGDSLSQIVKGVGGLLKNQGGAGALDGAFDIGLGATTFDSGALDIASSISGDGAFNIGAAGTILP